MEFTLEGYLFLVVVWIVIGILSHLGLNLHFYGSSIAPKEVKYPHTNFVRDALWGVITLISLGCVALILWYNSRQPQPPR
jgi:hypothetical protein